MWNVNVDEDVNVDVDKHVTVKRYGYGSVCGCASGYGC